MYTSQPICINYIYKHIDMKGTFYVQNSSDGWRDVSP